FLFAVDGADALRCWEARVALPPDALEGLSHVGGVTRDVAEGAVEDALHGLGIKWPRHIRDRSRGEGRRRRPLDCRGEAGNMDAVWRSLPSGKLQYAGSALQVQQFG